MRILALDLSLTATGWAITRGDLVSSYGVATPTNGLRGVERLQKWQEWLDLRSPDDDSPGYDLVVLEGYSMGSRGRAVFNIGEWGGVARLTIYQAGIPFVEVPPSTLKKFATGRGNAPKPDLRMELYKRSGLDVADDNAVDALWLLAAARERYGEPLWPMPKANVEALGKVDWPELDGRTEGTP